MSGEKTNLLKRLAVWLKYNFMPLKPRVIPFIELKPGAQFYFKGESFIKENDRLVFGDKPIRLPFHITETVEFYD